MNFQVYICECKGSRNILFSKDLVETIHKTVIACFGTSTLALYKLQSIMIWRFVFRRISDFEVTLLRLHHSHTREEVGIVSLIVTLSLLKNTNYKIYIINFFSSPDVFYSVSSIELEISLKQFWWIYHFLIFFHFSFIDFGSVFSFDFLTKIRTISYSGTVIELRWPIVREGNTDHLEVEGKWKKSKWKNKKN